VTDWNKLGELLESAGLQITFSRYCCSGLIGEDCECSRCRKQRGEAVTCESQALAAKLSRCADKAFRAGFKLATPQGKEAPE
jgi:hypothetical protein